jgi:DNA-binding NarL/FixJ family response regulator
MRRRIAKLLAATVDIEVVGEAGDGSQAVEGVQMVRPDVLLMEIDLPGLYEPNAAAELARACPDISIIVLTSFARRDLLARIDVGERGARGTKGNALEEFLIAIRTLGPGEVLKYPPR